MRKTHISGSNNERVPVLVDHCGYFLAVRLELLPLFSKVVSYIW